MEQTNWQKFYLFMYEAKSAAGIYFVAFVFFYLFYGILEPNQASSLDFWTAIQIFAACLLIGLGQSFLLTNNVTNSRITIWGCWSLSVTILFSELFQWFQSYPYWYRYVFYAAIALSLFFYWLALVWDLQRETKTLNRALEDYQQKNKK
ncbi:hypothetical protein [Jeotgalibaca sp. A122]|uniref:hypothetical protein n=1 Tax=Jeotgalibaca sp. A122 TaxID=3457322 RepID=UPI003FCF95DE